MPPIRFRNKPQHLLMLEQQCVAVLSTGAIIGRAVQRLPLVRPIRAAKPVPLECQDISSADLGAIVVPRLLEEGRRP